MFSESETQRLVGMLEGHQDVFSSLTVEETREIELQIVGMPNTVQPSFADIGIPDQDRELFLSDLQELDGFEFRPRDCRVALQARVFVGDVLTEPAVLLVPDYAAGWAVSLPRLLDPASDPSRTMRLYRGIYTRPSSTPVRHLLSQMIQSVNDLTYAPSMWRERHFTLLDGLEEASYQRALAVWQILLEIDRAQDTTRKINEGGCTAERERDLAVWQLLLRIDTARKINEGGCMAERERLLAWYESAQRARCLVKYLEAEARVRETATVMDRNIREAYELNKLLNEFLPYQVISGLLG
jgi:hypothetical protein|nr:MAG TPA: hypothetical protein [Caudoviricetes sp.]